MENFIIDKWYEEPTDKYSIVSVVIFRLSTSYKEMNVYFNGLKKLITNFKFIYPDCYLRLYFDSSLYDNNYPMFLYETEQIWKPFFDGLKSIDYIQLAKFDTKFKINKTYNEGLIGTIVRFLPLFDIEENRNLDKVISIDIDNSDDELKLLGEQYKKFNNFIEDGYEILYKVFSCYRIDNRFLAIEKHFNIEYPILAGFFYSKYKLPVKLLNDFFKCIKVNCNYYKDFFNSVSSSERNIKLKRFPYGIDELFLMLVNDYINKEKIKHVVVIFRYYYKFIKKYKDFCLKSGNGEIFAKFLKLIMGKYYSNTENIGINFTRFKSYMQFDTTYNLFDEYNYFDETIYNTIEKLYNDNTYKEYLLEKKDIKCILESKNKINYLTIN